MPSRKAYFLHWTLFGGIPEKHSFPREWALPCRRTEPRHWLPPGWDLGLVEMGRKGQEGAMLSVVTLNILTRNLPFSPLRMIMCPSALLGKERAVLTSIGPWQKHVSMILSSCSAGVHGCCPLNAHRPIVRTAKKVLIYIWMSPDKVLKL